MFAQRNFVACIEGELATRGFGAKRRGEILEKFEGLSSNLRAQGYGDQVAQSMAMSRVFDDLATRVKERAKRTAKVLEVQAAHTNAVQEAIAQPQSGKFAEAFKNVIDGGKGRGAMAARAAISFISNDVRFGTLSAERWMQGYREKYWALMSDTLVKDFGKGAFETQKGKAGLADIPREIYKPGSTGNVEAAAAAKAWNELSPIMVADRNKAGGSMNQLDNYLPQRLNSVKLRTKEDEFVNDVLQHANWDRMTWPDGSLIDVKDRERAVRAAWATLSTGGQNKLLDNLAVQRGSAIGNKLDEHRFLHFKDGDSWLYMHDKYGDGTVFDVMAHHVESMAHQNALVQVFGPNPELGYENLVNIVRAETSRLSRNPATALDVQAQEQANKVINARMKPMFDKFAHTNPMDANSPWAAGVVTTANVLTAAKLGSVPLIAAPGDFAQTLAVRMYNNFPGVADGMGQYLKAMSGLEYKELQGRMAQLGFIYDNMVGSKYTTERFSPIATYGKEWSRVLSDDIIRLSGLNRHTEIARAVAQHEMMAMLRNDMEKKFGELDYQHVLARYGIGETEWDAARKAITPWEAEPGAEFFRPLDILNTNLADKDRLYTAFHSFVGQEANYMVPGATIEADVTLSKGTRPDSMMGAIIHSFKMYKNFALTFAQMYGRMALAQERTSSKIGFAAAIMAGATFAGAVGVQLKELTQGRGPIPMDTASFWGKSFLAGGGASIYGDFLFGGVNRLGSTPAETIGGPLATLLNDSSNLAMGPSFKWVSAWDHDAIDKAPTPWARKVVDFAERYTPGTNLWQIRLVLERELWDTLDEMADPRAKAKFNARMQRQKKQYGNSYFWKPGSGIEGLSDGR